MNFRIGELIFVNLSLVSIAFHIILYGTTTADARVMDPLSNPLVGDATWGEAIAKESINSPMRKVRKSRREASPESEEDDDNDDAEIYAADEPNEELNEVAEATGSNKHKNSAIDDDDIYGAETLEDMAELETFYKNTRQNILRLHYAKKAI